MVNAGKRSEVTAELSKLVERHIDPKHDPRVYWAKEVSFNYATGHGVRVDYMRFVPANNSVSGIEKGDFYCYEVKSSVEDFHSPNGHNLIGDYNYYVMPREVFDAVKDEVPYGIGVLVPSTDRRRSLESVKQAKRRDRLQPVSEMLLMMFRSASRELRKAGM